MSAEHVSRLFELTVKTGREAELRTLIADMVRATDTETGAVDYEWYLAVERSSTTSAQGANR